MISANTHRARYSIEKSGAAMRNHRRSAMDWLRCPNNASPHGFGNYLMAQTHAQYWNFSMQLANEFDGYPSFLGRTRPWRQDNCRRLKGSNAGNINGIIPYDSRRLPQPLEMPSQVVHKAVVIVDQKQHEP